MRSLAPGQLGLGRCSEAEETPVAVLGHWVRAFEVFLWSLLRFHMVFWWFLDVLVWVWCALVEI